MEGNYNKILEKVSSISGIEKDEIDRRVEAKRAKLSGLISREGALQVIAAELSISFDNEKLKIDELLPGMRKVNFTGKVIRMFPIREYTTKTGDKGKVANIIVADDTSNIKIVLWDTNHISLLESGTVAEGISIEVASGSMRDNEVHLGSFSEFKTSSEVFENVQDTKPVKEKTIEEFSPGDSVKTRAFIVQAFDPRFYEANVETGKKITEEELANGVPSEKKAILNVVIDDGTDTIRAVMFHEMVQKVGLTEYDNTEAMAKQKQSLIGKEFYFGGTIKRNSYMNNYELGVNFVEEIDVDKLLSELE
jgi:replication factor A1